MTDKAFFKYFTLLCCVVLCCNGDLKQNRTATAVNKQLNFPVKNKPHTTNYSIILYTAYLKHLWLKVCERTVLTVFKSFLSNVYQRREGCCRAEDGKILIFTSSGRRQPFLRWKVLLKLDFKTVNVLSHTFNHRICFKYAVYIVGCVWFVFNGKI